MINPPFERFDTFEKKIAVRKAGICTECKECRQLRISFCRFVVSFRSSARRRDFVFLTRTSSHNQTELLSWTQTKMIFLFLSCFYFPVFRFKMMKYLLNSRTEG